MCTGGEMYAIVSITDIAECTLPPPLLMISSIGASGSMASRSSKHGVRAGVRVCEG